MVYWVKFSIKTFDGSTGWIGFSKLYDWSCLSYDLQIVMMLYNDEIIATRESEIKCKDNCV